MYKRQPMALAITHHGKHRPVSLVQTSLANLVTSSRAPVPPPSCHPPCRLLPGDHNKTGRSEALSTPGCQAATLYQLPHKSEPGLALRLLPGCKSLCVITASAR